MDFAAFLNTQAEKLIGAKVDQAITPPVARDPMSGATYQEGQPSGVVSSLKTMNPMLLIGAGVLVLGLAFVLLRK